MRFVLRRSSCALTAAIPPKGPHYGHKRFTLAPTIAMIRSGVEAAYIWDYETDVHDVVRTYSPTSSVLHGMILSMSQRHSSFRDERVELTPGCEMTTILSPRYRASECLKLGSLLFASQ
jgi:hypothetical protein